ncbi:hypothetical protein GI374_10005 [Paracoccus sp. S-4012]|uniref:ImuA family protein n=1 Tax=Paracoccus sp. S-4012 TaxID=2665648 RepID=UPI0012AEFF9B|nr:hypothetical protein [Paracoccus sp. S-4012]MRX50773.1 hypothetical protein [Paracoccus sp. S-4012]
MTARFDPSILLPAAPTSAGQVELAPGLGFAAGRVHELTGPARRTLALMLAARVEGPVVWIGPGNPGEGLMPQGVARWTLPERLLTVAARRAEDRLWAVEESLRSRAAGLVVAELDSPCGLTPVRRLLLAGEGGRAMALLLTPEGITPGTESRWRMDFAHRPGQDGWTLALQRARMVPPGRWRLRADTRGRVFTGAAPLAPAAGPETPPASCARAALAFPQVQPLDCTRHPPDPRRGATAAGSVRVGSPAPPERIVDKPPPRP